MDDSFSQSEGSKVMLRYKSLEGFRAGRSLPQTLHGQLCLNMLL